MSLVNNEERVERVLFERWPWLLWLAVALLFAVGIVIRVYDISDAPLDFHPTRQLHSALMARGVYYQNLESAPEWQRELAVRQWKAEQLIEPPLVENLAALMYRIAGEENLVFPRLTSVFFWMLGGVFLFSLARQLSGANGAVAALAFYLVLPYGAIASRSFQPDPLLMLSILMGFWGMYRWHRKPTWGNAVLAGALAGWAIFVKSVAVFFIGPAWLGLILSGMGFRKAIASRQVWLMAALTVLPYAGYHIYGMYISGLLAEQFTLRFFPNLLKDPAFFLRWNGMIMRVFGFEVFLAAVLGLFTIREKSGRAMLVSVLAGYFAYGIVFTYAISTHDYYQVPIIPLVALGLGAGVDVLLRHLRGSRWLVTAAVIFVLLFFTTIKAWDVRVTLKRDDYRGEMTFWQNLGKTIGEDKQVVGLLHDYGYRLAYWGWIQPTNWMTSADFNFRKLGGRDLDAAEIFAEEVQGKDLFVVTLLGELDSQPEIKALLENGYAVYKQAGDYIIYDLRQPLGPK